MSRGMGAYKRAGELFGPAGDILKAKVPTVRMPAPRKPPSRIRPGATLARFVDKWWTPRRIDGTSTIAVTAFDIPKLRHSTQ